MVGSIPSWETFGKNAGEDCSYANATNYFGGAMTCERWGNWSGWLAGKRDQLLGGWAYLRRGK